MKTQNSKLPMQRWLKKSKSSVGNLLFGWMLLSILMSVGCAWMRTEPPAPSRELASCYVPLKELQPTPVPLLNDEKNGQLLQEANDSRDAIQMCNNDKRDALKLIQLQNQLRQPAKP